MVEGWRNFTRSDFDMELIQGNHLFVYNADARDSWFESITDLLVAEGF
jgi:surfactin synthase thioesterase subunit